MMGLYILVLLLLAAGAWRMYLHSRRKYVRETMADIRGMMDSIQADLIDAELDAEEVERFLEERKGKIPRQSADWIRDDREGGKGNDTGF